MTTIESDRLSCEKCGTMFEPRSGSGGSSQRFCCTGCRLSFHKERLRSQRSASKAVPTPLPATGKPDHSETVPPKLTITAPRPGETGLLDVANCERTEFVVALKDGEPTGARIETRPAEVRAFMDQHVVGWIGDNKDEPSVHAITVAAPRHGSIQSCVTILHHSGSDKARQRTLTGAAYVAPRSLAATGASSDRDAPTQGRRPGAGSLGNKRA
jgi:hypothetical protein